MASNNVTKQTIIDTIDETFNGETLEFLASFIDYCNDRTAWGAPRMCCPLNSDMIISSGTLDVRVSDEALETEYSVNCLYSIEETLDEDNSYLVYVTPYAYDGEYYETTPYVYFPLSYKIVDPRELERLCDYIGVAFQSSYFS